MSASHSHQMDDEDPVLAEYDVYITPEQAEELFLFQYPNRASEQPYNDKNHMEPLGVRIKPETGFVEVDIPLQVHANFDKLKGVTWGESLRKSTDQGQHTFGLASGFERAPPPREAPGSRGRATTDAVEQEIPEEDIQTLLERFPDANDKGHVLNKQTIGGQFPPKEKGQPIFMLGAFRGSELHLTKLTGVVQMRTQFHHMDAASFIDQAAKRREREAGEAPKATEPRAVQMSARSTDNDNTDVVHNKLHLRDAGEEHWEKLRFRDEETDEAYDAYHNDLFVSDTSAARSLAAATANDEYIEEISAPRQEPNAKNKRRPLTRKQLRAIELSDDSDEDDELGGLPDNVEQLKNVA